MSISATPSTTQPGRNGGNSVLMGALLLGVVTSLTGLVLTVMAAARVEAEFAVANALGGEGELEADDSASSLFVGL